MGPDGEDQRMCDVINFSIPIKGIKRVSIDSARGQLDIEIITAIAVITIVVVFVVVVVVIVVLR